MILERLYGESNACSAPSGLRCHVPPGFFAKTLLCAAERHTSLDLHRALWAAAMVAWLQRTLVSTSHRPSRALASQQLRSKHSRGSSSPLRSCSPAIAP
jgi:hypothetical protein